ncbi:MAG TPA: archease [Candidatus Lokiarchaeia archaeon]|nr:archease [Candidatus Lokiarchaeia archaeon]
MSYEFLDHTADVSVRAWGATLAEVFEQAARALMETMWADSEIEPAETREIRAEGDDQAELLVNFLTEFLYLFDADGFAIGNIHVEELHKDGGTWHIVAQGVGEPFSLDKHHPGTEVKAITYSYIKVEEEDGQYVVEIVFDI